MFIKAEEIEEASAQNVSGGSGTIFSKDIWPKDLFPLAHGRFIRLVRIPKGSCTGFHTHEGEAEMYYAISGEAVVDDNGERKAFRPGDVLLTGNGQGHSIGNEKDADFFMMAVILKAGTTK